MTITITRRRLLGALVLLALMGAAAWVGWYYGQLSMEMWYVRGMRPCDPASVAQVCSTFAPTGPYGIGHAFID